MEFSRKEAYLNKKLLRIFQQITIVILSIKNDRVMRIPPLNCSIFHEKM